MKYREFCEIKETIDNYTSFILYIFIATVVCVVIVTLYLDVDIRGQRKKIEQQQANIQKLEKRLERIEKLPVITIEKK